MQLLCSSGKIRDHGVTFKEKLVDVFCNSAGLVVREVSAGFLLWGLLMSVHERRILIRIAVRETSRERFFETGLFRAAFQSAKRFRIIVSY